MARQMSHYVMVSLWCESLSIINRFRFLHFRMNNCLAYLMLDQEKEFANDSGRPLSYDNSTDIRIYKWFTNDSGFTNDYKICISTNKHPTKICSSLLFFIDCS